jgi:hypothetical protein
VKLSAHIDMQISFVAVPPYTPGIQSGPHSIIIKEYDLIGPGNFTVKMAIINFCTGLYPCCRNRTVTFDHVNIGVNSIPELD